MRSNLGPRKGTPWHDAAAEARRVAAAVAVAARAEAMRRRLLDALEAVPGPLDLMELAVALGYTSDQAYLLARLAELVAEGLVVEGEERRCSREHLRSSPYLCRVWSMAPRPRR